MHSEEIEELKAKRLCFDCIGESYLSNEISSEGKQAKCSYCGNMCRSYSVGVIAERIQMAFEQHYFRTPDHPNDWESNLLRDRESSYEWERHGEPVVDAIMNAAEIPEGAARDVQRILQEEHEDFESAAMGEETEFADNSYYEEQEVSDSAWQEQWHSFEKALKTETRFFNGAAALYFASVFDRIGELRTHDGRSVVVVAGPGTDFHTIYRARVFQSDDKLEAALCRPDQHLGPPPAFLAAAGRMNARGISVFYGANDPKATIAEVRPPVGSQVAVVQLEIIRMLRLLDLTALKSVRITGSIFDPDFATQLKRVQFFQSLSRRITQPVMPDDEPFEYLATQAIADFLATESSLSIDGILFPSAQIAGDVLNVVLFHKSARVEAMDIPEEAKITARAGLFGEDGWEPNYSVFEEVPPVPTETGKKDKDHRLPNFAMIAKMSLATVDSDLREVTLRILCDSIKVHRVNSVVFDTKDFPVQRYRKVKRVADI